MQISRSSNSDASTYDRGALVGLSELEEGVDFLAAGGVDPADGYDASGAMIRLDFANGVSERIERDLLGRSERFEVKGPGSQQPLLWASGNARAAHVVGCRE